MNTLNLPHLYGIAVDDVETQRFDDIFWVTREANNYVLSVCVPSMSQCDDRASPRYRKGFILGETIPAICFAFTIKSHHDTVGLKSFSAYECWATSIGNLTPTTNLQTVSEDVRTMLGDAVVLVRAFKHLFQKTGIYHFKDMHKDHSELLNTQFFMIFVNVVVANFAVHHKIPLLYYDLRLKKSFQVNVGLLKLVPHYAKLTSPLRRIEDVVNQCNIMAYFKQIEYPLDVHDLSYFGFGETYLIEPLVFNIIKRRVQPVDIVLANESTPTVIAMQKVIGNNHVAALETTYRLVGKPLPVYTFNTIKQPGRRLIECTVLAVDMMSSNVFTRMCSSLRKQQAQEDVAKDMYQFLQKRCIQKKAV